MHLDHCETCQSLLNAAAHALATAATAPLQDGEEATWNTTFRPGTLVGWRYLIRDFIARGGMGEVYDAFDRELQEHVALKTVNSTACDNPNAVRRLKAEVQLARRVSHPNVCRIYDFGTHAMNDTGALISFLTMELLNGETLGQRVRLSGALPVAEACELAREMLRGLCAAHDAGVLHRDLKSDNVMLRENDSGGCSPLILDFGLARALGHDSQHASASHPHLVGTFGYIAPEQLEGKPHSRASDVYSFGVVWFEMLTGELPFESESSPALAALERLHRPAPAPSSKNSEVSKELDAVVLRCLNRSPKERFRTAAEVLTALDELETRRRYRSKKRVLTPFLLAALPVAVLVAYFAQQALREGAQRGAVVSLNAATVASTAPRVASSKGEPPAIPLRAINSDAGSLPAASSSAPAIPRKVGGPRVTTPSIESVGRTTPPERAATRASDSVAVVPPIASNHSAPSTSSVPSKGWENPFSVKGPNENQLATSVSGAQLEHSQR